MRNDFYVYAWTRPDTDEVFYVGKGRGKRDVSMKRSNPHFMNIIEKLMRDGLAATVARVHDNLSEEDAFQLEREEIARHGRRNLGTGSLANLTDGGEGCSGAIVSAETRARRSVAMRGIPRTRQWLERMSSGLSGNQNALGAVRSPETRARMSAAQRLQPSPSAAVRAKISTAVTGVVRSAPPRADNTSGFKGVSFAKGRNKWQAKILLDGRQVALGRYQTSEEAARAYDGAALKAWGTSCYLNFPPLAANDNHRGDALAA